MKTSIDGGFRRARSVAAAFVALALTISTQTTWAGHDHANSAKSNELIEGSLLTSGLVGSIGGAIGPDRALYVPQGGIGEITRIDVSTGETSVFASGLPAAFPFVGIGGPMDVAFIGRTAYVLVSLVGDPLFNGGSQGSQKDGIYRVNPDGSVELVVDLGQFNVDNPPPLGSLDPAPPAGQFNYFLVNGVQYALQRSGAGFLVSDGHLNRILRVTRRGVSIVKSFGDVVPTGMDTALGRLFFAETGPIVGDQEIGAVASLKLFPPHRLGTVASGISMAVDVEFGPRGHLYAISQGTFGGGDPGSPAAPNTGQLLRINDDGTTTVLADEINLPTSLHFLGSTALVVTLAGEVWKFDVADCDGPDFGHHKHR